MLYAERPPHPALANHIRCLWMFEASPDDGAADIQRVVPDGYPEMVLHYGDHGHEVDAGGGLQRQSRFVFAGQISQPLLLQPGARAGMIGIRLQPAGARTFLGMPMREMTDVRLDLSLIWAQEAESLVDAVCNAGDGDTRMRIVEHFLHQKLINACAHVDTSVAHGVSLLRSSETVQESWLGPKGKMMAAASLTSSAKRTSFEFLRIVETAAGLVCLASPGGKTPVEFELKEMADKRVVFENPTHDFPQRVMYWIEPDGAMTARVEGTIAGKLRGMQWRFELTK